MPRIEANIDPIDPDVISTVRYLYEDMFEDHRIRILARALATQMLITNKLLSMLEYGLVHISADPPDENIQFGERD